MKKNIFIIPLIALFICACKSKPKQDSISTSSISSEISESEELSLSESLEDSESISKDEESESESQESESEEESEPISESTSSYGDDSESEPPVDPNAKYYKDVDTSSKQALNNSLQTLMFNTHKTYPSYGDIRYLFKYSDADPNKSGNILCFYSHQSMSATWDQGTTYNREHVWPKANSGGLFPGSIVNNNYKGAGSDLHHVRPAKTDINGDRGNTKFGQYIPNDNVKGDVARIIMYTYVHYASSISGTGTNRNNYVGNLNLLNVFINLPLIKTWNNLDPVDDLEKNRNEYVYEKQGNRNPFIDHPEWVNISIGN